LQKSLQHVMNQMGLCIVAAFCQKDHHLLLLTFKTIFQQYCNKGRTGDLQESLQHATNQMGLCSIGHYHSNIRYMALPSCTAWPSSTSASDCITHPVIHLNCLYGHKSDWKFFVRPWKPCWQSPFWCGNYIFQQSTIEKIGREHGNALVLRTVGSKLTRSIFSQRQI